MLPPTASRVAANTRPEINEKILEQTQVNIAKYGAGPAGEIDLRLAQLDREWDTERFLEANATGLSLLGLILALLHNWWWLLIPFTGL